MSRKSNKLARGMWQSDTRPLPPIPIDRPKTNITAKALMAWIDEAASFRAQDINKTTFHVRDSVSNRLLAALTIDGTNLIVRAETGEHRELSLFWTMMDRSEYITKTDIPLSDPNLRMRMMRAINGAYA